MSPSLFSRARSAVTAFLAGFVGAASAGPAAGLALAPRAHHDDTCPHEHPGPTPSAVRAALGERASRRRGCC
jgi:hypothetical protein